MQYTSYYVHVAVYDGGYGMSQFPWLCRDNKLNICIYNCEVKICVCTQV